MPIQCEYFAMEGLTQMIDVIRDVMQAENTRLAFGGILLTMFDHTLELTHEVEREVRDFFGEIVYRDRRAARRGGGRGAQPWPRRARLRPALPRLASVCGTLLGGDGNRICRRHTRDSRTRSCGLHWLILP